jgi:translocation and assembly module TamA
VQHLAPWKSGDIYEPDDIAELERRLRDTGVYDTVSVSLAPKDKVLPDGLRPVIVTLADRKAKTVELGASYSSTDGPGVDAKWIRYNRLHRADTTTLTARLAKLDSRLEAELALPHWRRSQQTLKLNTAIFRDNTDAYTETGGHIGADLTRRLQPTVYRTYGVSLDLSQIDSPTTSNGVTTDVRQNFATFTLLGAQAWDRSDSVLDPTKGWRLDARAEPTAITGDLTMAFLKVQAQSTAYLPFGEGRADRAGRADQSRADPGRHHARGAGLQALLRRRRRFGARLFLPGHRAADRQHHHAAGRPVSAGKLARTAPQIHRHMGGGRLHRRRRGRGRQVAERR